MTELIHVSAAIALLIAIYSIGAGLGEMLRPGGWKAMLADIEKSPATGFLTGLVCLAIGGAVYLLTPAWGEGAWLDLLIKTIGAIMIVEGFLFFAFRHAFIGFARILMGKAGRLWAAVSILIGVLLALAAFSRF